MGRFILLLLTWTIFAVSSTPIDYEKDFLDEEAADNKEITEAVKSGTYDPKTHKVVNPEGKNDDFADDLINSERPIEGMFGNDAENEKHEVKAPSFISELKEEELENTLPEDNSDDEHNTVTDQIMGINEHIDAYFEGGDMLKGNDDQNDVEKRNAIKSTSRHWPNGIVFFEYAKSISKSAKAVIETGIDEFHKHTCLKFRHYTKDMGNIKRVQFFKGGGCYSYVGKYGSSGTQPVSIGNGCAYKGIVMHELMHAIGFYHEQSRYDRDTYVRIIWSNIQDGKASNFKKQTADHITTLGQPYDYDGLMHYGKYAFAKDRSKPTIEPIDSSIKTLGQRKGFSNVDKLQVRKLYNCPDVAPGWSSWGPYSPCDDKCVRTRKKFCNHDDKSSCTGYDQSNNGVILGFKNCTASECIVNGNWGPWGPWGPCSKTCDEVGTRTRTRRCDDPPPKHGGKSCPGSSTSSSTCELGPCQLGPDDCTFESGRCSWTTTDRRWTTRRGTTPSVTTGPPGDHTLGGTGIYIFYEVSQMTDAEKVGSLTSKTFTPSGPQCMIFWYSMYGSEIGTLNVLLKSGSTEVTLFERKGNQGTEWKKEKLDIIGQQSYQVIFRVTYGTGWRGDIALDDIQFKAGQCNAPASSTASPSTAAPTTTSTPSTAPSTSSPVPPTTTQPPTTNSPTTTQPPTTTSATTTQPPTTTSATTTQPPTTTSPTTTQPPTTTLPTTTQPPTTSSPLPPSTTAQPPSTPGPVPMPAFISCSFDDMCGFTVTSGNWTLSNSGAKLADHTNEKGKFLTSAPDRMSTIASREGKGDGNDRCVEFFFVKPSDVELDFAISEGGIYNYIVYRTSQEKSNKWVQAQATFTVKSGSVAQLVFESTGQVHIDDLSVSLGPCPESITLPLPSILTCGFEKGLCAWQQSIDDNFNWSRRRGRTPSFGTGPNRSATGPRDFYAYIEASYPRRRGQRAILRSPAITSHTPYCMYFAANLFGSQLGYLEVVAVDLYGKEYKLYTGNRKPTNKWSLVKISLPSKDDFEIEIIGVRGRGYKGDIAIDEIRVVPGTCL